MIFWQPRVVLVALVAAGLGALAQDLNATACASTCISTALGGPSDCVNLGLADVDAVIQNGGKAITSSNATDVTGKACVCEASSGNIHDTVVQCFKQKCSGVATSVDNALKTVCKGNTKAGDVADGPGGALHSTQPLVAGALALALASALSLAL